MLVLGLWPVDARADWHLTPFFGLLLGGETTFNDPDRAAGTTKSVYGGSASVLTPGILGLEADFGYVPGFFERRGGTEVTDSRVITLTGNAIVTLPVWLTRESLRPYVVGGLGFMQVNVTTLVPTLDIDRRVLAFDAGAGVVGFVSPWTGVRFEIRHFRSLASSEERGGVAFGRPHLSFWRLSAGVVLRR